MYRSVPSFSLRDAEQKQKVIQSDGNINEPKFIWPAAYRWQTSRLCAETPCSSFIQRVKSSSKDTHMCMYVTVWVWARGRVSGQVNARELFFHCHIFGMAVLCPRLLHSWWISMQCGVVTETGADMLSHCDEKHSEMMWRECSSCPQRDGKLAVAFVYSFVPPWLCENACVCEYFFGFSLGAFVIVRSYCLLLKPISLHTQSGWLCFFCVFVVAVAKVHVSIRKPTPVLQLR